MDSQQENKPHGPKDEPLLFLEICTLVAKETPRNDHKVQRAAAGQDNNNNNHNKDSSSLIYQTECYSPVGCCQQTVSSGAGVCSWSLSPVTHLGSPGGREKGEERGRESQHLTSGRSRFARLHELRVPVGFFFCRFKSFH